MQSYVDQRGFAGISTMLARRGKIVHFEQVGWQDRERRTPLTADTIYRIYSMTKPIICTALMTLYEEGRFQLFDPLAKYLPAFGKLRVYTDGGTVDPVRPILVRDLFTHTVGPDLQLPRGSRRCARCIARRGCLATQAARSKA